jgi:hypothetical protein
VNLMGQLPPALAQQLSGAHGGGFNPTGDKSPMPTGSAGQGSGGQQGIPIAPQATPVNTVSQGLPQV